MSDAPKETRCSAGKRKATHADPPPRSLAPQLATPVDAPPKPGDWQWEIKLDGYRMLARIDGEQVRLFTRNWHDWTSKLPRLQKAIQELKLGFAWLDGEIVIISERGRTDFQALQNAFESTSNSGDSTVIASDSRSTIQPLLRRIACTSVGLASWIFPMRSVASQPGWQDFRKFPVLRIVRGCPNAQAVIRNEPRKDRRKRQIDHGDF